MASRRGSARSRAIGKVKIGARKLGLNHDEYCNLLDRVTNRRSCVDLDIEELGWVIEEMERLGACFEPDGKRRKRPAAKACAEKAPLIRKIRALLAEANRPEEYAEAILRKMTKHEHRTPLEWGTPQQLYKVVQALMVDQRRRATREGA